MIILVDTVDRLPSPAAERVEDASADRTLEAVAALFTGAILIHGADHARRGADGISGDVFWAGTSAVGLQSFVVVLVCSLHR